MLDLLDIAAGTSGVWTSGVTYDGPGTLTFGAGSCGKYAPFDNEGRYGYMNVYVASQLSQLHRYDVKNRVITTITPTDWIQSGTAAAGDRLACMAICDGTDRYSLVFLMSHLATNCFEFIPLV